MITIEELNEVKDIVKDLTISLRFKERVDKNEPFLVLPLNSGEITVIFDEAKKTEVNTKISELENLLKTKLADLDLKK